MPARIPQHVREEQLNALPGKRFVRWVDGYNNQRSKAVMCCDKGHEWPATVTNLIDHGRGCPKCSTNNIRYSAEDRVCHLNSLPGLRFVCWVDGWHGNFSKALMRCEKGHEWPSSVNNLLNHRRGCPKCAGRYSYSPFEREEQLNALPGMQFVRWSSQSKATMKCERGHEWAATVDCLVNSGTGCPKCAGNHRYSADDRVRQLEALPGKAFVCWVSNYRDKNSKAVMRCDKGHEWDAAVDCLVNEGTGCPSCAKSGYDPSKPGTLYALRNAEGTHIKIGISNTHKRRLAELRRATPFDFEPIHIHHCDDGGIIRDLEKIFHDSFESSGFTKFDGATEWLKFDPQILYLLRILGA